MKQDQPKHTLFSLHVADVRHALAVARVLSPGRTNVTMLISDDQGVVGYPPPDRLYVRFGE